MSATGHRKRDSRSRAPRRRPTPTLVLLDYPDENELVGKPITAVGPPRLTERRRVRAFAVAAGVVVAMGSIIGGSVAFGGGVGVRTLRATAPGPLIIPKTPDTSPAQTGLAPTAPSGQPGGTSQPSPSVPPTAVSQPPTAQPSPAAVAAPIAVTYVVDNEWPDGFQGELIITNNTAEPISGWQIVVALPQDQFNTWWNATGYMSNGILLLNPEPYSGPLEPGQTLHVYFNATGGQTSPTVCAFNEVACATS